VKKWMLILVVIGSLGANGQEMMLPELGETDSLQLNMERDLMYRQLLSGSLRPGDLMLPFELPELDFNAGLASRWTFNPSDVFANHIQFETPFAGINDLAPSPFLSNGRVFSSSAWQLNDRLIMGGYSFGANSVFTAPLPTRGLNNFDVRGSTFFMQYKVSKNFKIETRVNVSQGPGPGY
jgi:hypothetical protein